MRIVSGRVVGGKVVVEGSPLAEGAVVTVVAPDDSESFEVPEESESELLRSMDDAARGDVVSAEELLVRLRRHG